MASEKYDNYNFPHTHPDDDISKGHPGGTDDLQDAQVHQLRGLLEQEGYTERLDTNTMLRFLRARKFDVQLSKAMYIKAEKWRKEKDLDNLVRTWTYPEKPKVFEYYPQYYHKTDKDGRPVYIEKLGNIDLSKLHEITNEGRMLDNLAVEYERFADPRLPACSRKAGRLLETCCTIMDLKGVSILRVPSTYNYLKQASAISQDYYPERLGKLFIINAPWGFTSVWNIVSGWLDPVTVKKIKVLGTSYKDDLLRQIASENLPVEFGGTCTCEGGCQLSDAGPWNDPQYQGSFFKPSGEVKKEREPEPTATETPAPAPIAAPDATA
ncbi:cytosolic factor, phosphatidylinositol/phosphatidylcholine transfer protein [Orbilia ellipsospora]|uniref:Cytosolic factor, phosphatidylinositol/phosphatidylcholine transfer protein n=1 Tax=Orbilia ellipsospora TaxID=2528407 RepID=A0AAV9XN18_9PEZI